MDSFKSKMKEKIKQYSNEQYLDGYIKSEFLTGDGDADIYLNIGDRFELFDSWTIGNQVDLEKEVYEYIEEKTAMLGNHMPIHLHIIGCEFSSKEQEEIRHILKEHYAIELYKVQQKYMNLKKKIVGLILFGLFSFLLYTILYFLKDFNYLVEVFGFLFSFSLWEAMDCVIYALSDVKYQRESVTQNLLMNVDFTDDRTKEKDI